MVLRAVEAAKSGLAQSEPSDTEASINQPETEERQRVEQSFANFPKNKDDTSIAAPAPTAPTSKVTRKGPPKKPVLTIREKKARAVRLAQTACFILVSKILLDILPCRAR